MNFEHALKIEDLGIEFKRFKSGKAEFYICQWDNGHDSHLYSVGIVDQIGRWAATLSIDGRRVGGCDADTRSRCADMAVYAMRAVILRGHRRTLRTLRREKEAAIEMRPNCRGFLCGTFRDNKGEECSLQESSNVKPCVWLGIDEPQPVVMSADVAGLASPRLEPIDGSTETTGWHRYVLPDGVRVFGRMELDRETAGRLAAALAHFAKNGALPKKGGAE